MLKQNIFSSLCLAFLFSISLSQFSCNKRNSDNDKLDNENANYEQVLYTARNDNNSNSGNIINSNIAKVVKIKKENAIFERFKSSELWNKLVSEGQVEFSNATKSYIEGSKIQLVTVSLKRAIQKVRRIMNFCKQKLPYYPL